MIVFYRIDYPRQERNIEADISWSRWQRTSRVPSVLSEKSIQLIGFKEILEDRIYALAHPLHEQSPGLCLYGNPK